MRIKDCARNSRKGVWNSLLKAETKSSNVRLLLVFLVLCGSDVKKQERDVFGRDRLLRENVLLFYKTSLQITQDVIMA